MNIAAAINGMLEGKTVVCGDSAHTRYRIVNGILEHKLGGELNFSKLSSGESLTNARYFESDTVTVPKSELDALRKKLDELEGKA